MQKRYLFNRIGLVLFISATIFACQDDELGKGIPGGINNGNGGDPEEKPFTDYSVKGIINNPEGDNMLVWSANDEITLWDVIGKKNNTFVIDESYDGNSPLPEATFKCNVNLDGADVLIGLYPQKNGEDFESLSKVSVNDTCKEMRSDKGNVITYMVSKGKVKDGSISDMTFTPLTTLVKFKVSNSDAKETVKVNYITISSENEIFSSELRINDNGLIENLNNSYKSVTLDLEGKELAIGSSIDGILGFLPTDLATPETDVWVTVNISRGDNPEQEIIPIFEGTLSNFLISAGTELQNESAEASESMIKEGYRYNVSVDLNNSLIPESGIEKDEQGNTVVYTSEGLLAWVNGSIAGNYVSNENIRIETKYLLDGIMDFKGAEWKRKDNFIGTFDGNGVVFTNLRFKSDGGYTSLFGELAEGSIVKNVTLKNIVAKDVKNGLGLIASVNKGIVENCVIDGGEFEVTASSNDSQQGLIAGKLDGKGLIMDCKLTGNVKLTTNQHAGGIVGKVLSNDSKIIGTLVDSSVEITSKGQANVGGFVGIFDNCKIYACAYLGTIYVQTDKIYGNSGGFVGEGWVVNNKSLEIIGCYSAGRIISYQPQPASLGGFVGNGEGESGSYKISGCYSMPDFGIFNSYGRSGAFLGKANSDKILWDCDDVYNFSDLKHSGLRGQYPGITDVKSSLSWNLIMSKMNSRIPSDVKYKFERNPNEGVPFILVKTN